MSAHVHSLQAEGSVTYLYCLPALSQNEWIPDQVYLLCLSWIAMKAKQMACKCMKNVQTYAQR